MPQGRPLHAPGSLVVSGRCRDTARHSDIQTVARQGLVGAVRGRGCSVLRPHVGQGETADDGVYLGQGCSVSAVRRECRNVVVIRGLSPRVARCRDAPQARSGVQS